MALKVALAATLAGAVVDAQANRMNSTCVPGMSPSLYGQSVTLIDGSNMSLAAWQGNLTIVVNVASFWGETVSHYNGLNQLLTQYAGKLQVLGMPCGQFMNQEPGANDEILNTLKYVRPGGGYVPMFPLTQKTYVNGGIIHPIWTGVRAACMGPTDDLSDLDYPGWSPISIRDVQWNFEKVLFDKTGQPFRRYSTNLEPAALIPDIEALLAA